MNDSVNDFCRQTGLVIFSIYHHMSVIWVLFSINSFTQIILHAYLIWCWDFFLYLHRDILFECDVGVCLTFQTRLWTYPLYCIVVKLITLCMCERAINKITCNGNQTHASWFPNCFKKIQLYLILRTAKHVEENWKAYKT